MILLSSNGLKLHVVTCVTFVFSNIYYLFIGVKRSLLFQSHNRLWAQDISTMSSKEIEVKSFSVCYVLVRKKLAESGRMDIPHFEKLNSSNCALWKLPTQNNISNRYVVNIYIYILCPCLLRISNRHLIDE